MTRWLCALVAGCLVHMSARADETYRCSVVRAGLLAELGRAERHPIRLATPARSEPDEQGEVEPCASFARVAEALRTPAGTIERGTLDGHAVAVESDGPHGSGHYWDVTIAVDVNGRALGACLTTATSGWRNLPETARRQLGPWRAVAGDHVQLWSTLVAGGAEWESLIVPLLFRLADGALRLDRAATLKELDRLGRLYAAAAALRDDRAAPLHRAAAAAYRSLAPGSACD